MLGREGRAVPRVGQHDARVATHQPEVDLLVEAVFGIDVSEAGVGQRLRLGNDVTQGGAGPERGRDQRPADDVADARERDDLLVLREVGAEFRERQIERPLYCAVDDQAPR